jgi:N-acetylneuraminic acid mutarotase
MKVRNWPFFPWFTVVLLAGCGEAMQPASDEMRAIEAGADPSLAGNRWAAKRPLPVPRWWTIAGSIGSSAYVIGGVRQSDRTVVSRVDAYNLTTNRWSQVAPLPNPRVASNGATLIGGKLYVTGGRGRDELPTKTLFVYDPQSNTWARKADMPRVGHHGVQGAIGGKLYVYMPAAGSDPCPILLRYDPATNVWVRRAPPPTEHSRGAGGVVNGLFYLAGGYTRDCAAGEEHWSVHRRVEAYDPASDRWTVKTPMTALRSDMSGVVLGARLHVVGGVEGLVEFPTDLPTLEAYNPLTDRWVTLASLPTGHALGAAALLGGKLLYVSGSGGGAASEVYTYTP